MIADAYRCAEGGGVSKEIILGQRIDRFGVKAVFGRDVMGANEMSRIIIAENIVAAYKDRKKSSNWVEWQINNPQMSELLNIGAELVSDG